MHPALCWSEPFVPCNGLTPHSGATPSLTEVTKLGESNYKSRVQFQSPEWHHMFGGMESAGVAMVMARRESVPANAHRPKSPLAKSYSLPPAGGVRKSVSVMYT